MDAHVKQVKDEILTAYGEFEQKLGELKDRTEKDYCFAGHIWGAAIDWRRAAGRDEVKIEVGRGNAFWNAASWVLVESETEADTENLTEQQADEQLLPALREELGQRIAAQPFGGAYMPDVAIKLIFRCDESGLLCERALEFSSEEKQKLARERLREFWTTDAYAQCDPRGAAASMERAYDYLLYDLLDELGVEAVKQRLATMIETHKRKIAEAGDSPGVEKGDLGKQTEAYLLFAEKNGVVARDYWDRDDDEDEDDELDDEEKPTVALADETMDLLCFMAVDMIRYSKDYHAQKGVEILKELGKRNYAPAKQLLTRGTGAVPETDAVWKSDLAECSCNDVFNTITFKIKDETEPTYAYLLDYILNLMATEFPKSYEVKLNSKLKNYLPVKSLNKSATHKFWVNCVSYAALRPKVVEYVRGMTADTWFYADAGSETGMATGGYAMLALALEDEGYAALFADYMDTNKSYDHNIFGDDAITAYLNKWGITAKNAEAAAQCVAWHDNLSPKKIDLSGFKDENVLAIVNEMGLQPRSFERIVKYTWGSQKKFKDKVAAASGEQKKQMERLLENANANE